MTAQAVGATGEAVLPEAGADGVPREIGLRERKKRRTRDQLIDAAFELFAERGFDRTSVEEIADVVGISARTFFRYFASKEDVVLQTIDDQCGRLLVELGERPRDERVLVALRHASVAALQAWERDEASLSAERLMLMMRLLAQSPALAAHAIHRRSVHLSELTCWVAGRMGTAPGDPRPMLVAAVVMAAVPTASHAWRQQEPDVAPSALVDRAFALLEAGLDYPAVESPAAEPQ